MEFSRAVISFFLLSVHCAAARRDLLSDPRSLCHSVCWQNASHRRDAKDNCIGSCIKSISEIPLITHSPDNGQQLQSATTYPRLLRKLPEERATRAAAGMDAPTSACNLCTELPPNPFPIWKKANFARVLRSGDFSQGYPEYQKMSNDVRLTRGDSLEPRKFSQFVRIGRIKGAFVRIGKQPFDGLRLSVAEANQQKATQGSRKQNC